jgi:hypothetical protein
MTVVIPFVLRFGEIVAVFLLTLREKEAINVPSATCLYRASSDVHVRLTFETFGFKPRGEAATIISHET